MNRKTLETISLIFAITSLLIFILGAFLFQYNRNFHSSSPIDAAVFGTFGDFVGGISGTLIAFASFAYIYIGLMEQRENFKHQRDSDSINEYISSFQNRILSSDISIGSKQHNGYNAIQKISERLINETENEIDEFARRLICYHPDLIDSQLHSEMIDQIPFAKAVFANSSKSEFISALKGRKTNERWEYLKSIFGYPDKRTTEQTEILKGFGSRAFYKCAFSERQKVYNDVLNTVRESFSGFLEMYLQGLEGFYQVIYSTHDKERYYSAFRNMFSLHEEVLLFYYLCSKNGSPEFMELAKNAKVFRNLVSRPYLMFDYPSPEKICREIDHAL